MLNITEINRINQFLELRHDWNKVLERSRDNNVFLTWEYLSTYWKHFGKEKQLRILCAEDKNEIVAIAPLRQSCYNFANPFSYNVIEPLGYRGLAPEGADYTGLLLAEREAECLQLFLNYLVGQSDWDFIYLMDTPGTSIIPDLLAKMSKNIPLISELEKGVICPYISLPTSIDILMSKLSKNLRQNLRKYMRRLEKDYRRVEFKKYDEFGSIKDAMTIFFKLHQKRWKSKHMLGVFNTQKLRDFYIDVAKLFADNGWLALYFLTANDEPIAAEYSFVYNLKMYFCLGGFDPDYSQYSVGNLTHQKAMEKCILNKIKEYDFLKGDEPYKFRWTTKYRRNLGIRFVNKSFNSHLYHWGIKIAKKFGAHLLTDKIMRKPSS